jgi:hypothetical protein
VPPPPVAGAAEGNELADWFGAADGLGVADRVGVAVCVGVAVELAVAVGVPLAVRLGVSVGVAGPVAPGENVAGVVEGEDPAQAETDAEASMAKVAQRATVNLVLAPVPTMVVRILMWPPHAPAGGEPFPSRHRKIKPMDGTDTQWPIHHWNIRLRD